MTLRLREVMLGAMFLLAMAVAMILVVLGIVPLVCLQIAGLTTATAITVGLFLVGSIIERRRLEAVNAELNSWPELYISVRKGR